MRDERSSSDARTRAANGSDSLCQFIQCGKQALALTTVDSSPPLCTALREARYRSLPKPHESNGCGKTTKGR
jgi:hypothetical protein